MAYPVVDSWEPMKCGLCSGLIPAGEVVRFHNNETGGEGLTHSNSGCATEMKFYLTFLENIDFSMEKVELVYRNRAW